MNRSARCKPRRAKGKKMWLQSSKPLILLITHRVGPKWLSNLKELKICFGKEDTCTLGCSAASKPKLSLWRTIPHQPNYCLSVCLVLAIIVVCLIHAEMMYTFERSKLTVVPKTTHPIKLRTQTFLTLFTFGIKMIPASGCCPYMDLRDRCL